MKRAQAPQPVTLASSNDAPRRGAAGTSPPTIMLALWPSPHGDLLIRLVVVAAVALFAFVQATQRGLGLYGDSSDYVECARSVLRGEGMLLVAPDGTPRPMVQFPPLYPLLIAAAARLTGDELTGARALHGTCLVVSVILVGWITCRAGRSAHWGSAAALLVALAGAFQGVHVRMFSEPCFVALLLAGVALVFEALARRAVGAAHVWWLIGAGVAIGGAALARYAGIYFVAAVAVAVALVGGGAGVGWRRRVRDAAIFGAVASCGLGMWFVRNRLTGAQPARHLAVHPPGLAHFRQLWATVSAWSFAIDVPAVGTTLGVGFTAALLALAVYGLRRRGGGFRDAFTGWVAAAAMGYVLFLIASFTFADAAMPFDYRILIPILPLSVIALCAGAAAWMRRTARHHPVRTRRAAAVLALMVVTTAVLSAFTLGQFAHDTATRGLGYAARFWRVSPTLKAVRRLPPDCIVWSNAPDVIRLLLGRDARPLPMHRLRTVARPNRRRFEELHAIAQAMRDRRGGAVVWFDRVDRSDMIVPETVAVNRLPLRRARELPDGRLYLFDPTLQANAPPATSTAAPSTTPARE